MCCWKKYSLALFYFHIECYSWHADFQEEGAFWYWVWKVFFPICFSSQIIPVINLMEMWLTHYLWTLLFQVLTIVVDAPTQMATAATSASQCQISSGCVVAPMEWAWLLITWRVWKTRPMNRPWSNVAPFPSRVPMADVCPATTAVMALMTVMITVMSIYVGCLVSSL